MPQDDMMKPVGQGISLIGYLLVAVSVSLLLYIAFTINHILTDPTQVPIVKFFIDKIGSSDAGISGMADGKPFEVRLGEPVRYMMYVIMGAMALGILTRVFSVLMAAGTGMIKAGSAMQQGSVPAGTVSGDTSGRPPGF